MTYNIRDGGEGRERIILDVFTSVQPEIILLQEVTNPQVVNHWAAQLGMKAIVAGGFTYRHVAILSRYSIVSSRSYTPIPKLSRDFLAATIEYQSGQLMNLYCIHLIAQPFLPFEWMRTVETKAVLRQATRQPAMPCLIAGDFNAVSTTDNPLINLFPVHLKALLTLQGNRLPHSVIARVLDAGFTDCFRALHTDPGFTLPTPKPTIRYDYIFVNPVLRPFLDQCFVVRQSSAVEHASDHYPVVAQFSL